MQIRIHYHHTDSGGVVYYANYFKVLDEARTEYLEARGLSIKGLVEEGILFVVARQEIDYTLPVRYGDTLSIDTRITNLSGARIEFEGLVSNQHAQRCLTARTTLACVDRNFRPKAIPRKIRSCI